MSYFLTNATLTRCGFVYQVLFWGESAESLVQPCGAWIGKASGAIVFFRSSPILEHGANAIPRATPSADSEVHVMMCVVEMQAARRANPRRGSMGRWISWETTFGARQASLTEGGKGAESRR